MEREARLARGEEEEEENIYAVNEEEVGDDSGDVTFPVSSVLPAWTWCYPVCCCPAPLPTTQFSKNQH